MSYRSPMLISEPQLKWPIVMIAAFITTAIALLAVGMQFVTAIQDTATVASDILRKAKKWLSGQAV